MNKPSLVSAVFALLAVGFAIGAEPTGEQIYRKQCASCHGEAGEGAKKYKKPLAGDKSVEQLTRLIAKTMPEDNPETLTANEAQKVAAYIHDAFYSVAARERNKPPRVELARLTVKQYRNAVADLIASFRPPAKVDGTNGLRGEYHGSRNFRGNRRFIDRTDAEVRFNFGTVGPDARFDPYEFSIRWEGSVFAPETGEYEFIVHTDHALRLWINNNRIAAIDAWVKSGSNTEFRTSIFLIAGRSYALRLEFSKSQQGVNNPKRAKAKPPAPAFVELHWKRPHRVAEVIPSRFLNTAKVPENYVPSAAFPPDDRSFGWERGTTISKAWDQATTDAAIDAAGYVVANLDELAGGGDRAARARDFARRFVERAFRRPLTDEERRLYVDHQFATTKDVEQAIKRVVLFTLKSPRFLYREPPAASDPYAVASRLSFALWDSIPDEELLKAAAGGKLATRDDVARQAERLLGDPRARAKLRGFMHTWLKVDEPRDLMKDPKRFPGFDPVVVADLQTSLDLFLDDVLWSKDSDFRRLLRDDSVYLNGRLAKFYGVAYSDKDSLSRIAMSILLRSPAMLPPADLPFHRVKMDAGERAGVLTHPYLLAAFAYSGATSPIHRGVFLARGVLGVTLQPPQEAFTPLSEDLHPTLTTRERVMLQTKPANCQSCHAVINPLGFTLERFDAVGRYRTQDNKKPIDATGTYETRSGKIVKLTGARELGEFLAASDEVHAAFVQQMFHHLVQQPMRAYGANTLNDLRQSFVSGQFNMRKLAVAMVIVAALPNDEKKMSMPK